MRSAGARGTAAVDRVSGQPELEHTPAALQPFPVAWHAFVLRSEAASCVNRDYRVSARGDRYRRYQLAGQPGAQGRHELRFVHTGDQCARFDGGNAELRNGRKLTARRPLAYAGSERA